MKGGARTLRNDESSWMVIHIAHGAQRAQIVQNLLEAEGFLIRKRSVGVSAGEENTFELMALTSEAKEARAFLIEADLTIL